MPEEKKKDSFTFSDKIKNSKQPASKSFANRISSKVGNDGKPKRTLFERTKRDAPFIIAATVALLLLPFLYKYSGQVSEEPIVAPSVEEIFDPERYGYDVVAGDPEGQIAQLAGRDPLSLIKGFGTVEEPETFDSLGSFDRSGLEDTPSYSDTSEERNTTNIYKRNAAPQTRAAFKRSATKIGKLSSTGLNGRSGGKLGVGMWGGGLKTAAKRVKTETPKSSPKPVSLQPLTSAGKPSRSYFGQGAAEQARRSKDAMSKANAMQALMDATYKPVEPGKIGGITGGDMGGPGGGNGNLERNFAFNGKEPWWWDMMKRRSQMEWEKKFNHKWGWVDFAGGLLQKFLDPFLSCIITGTDDWSMGNMFGAVAGSGDEAECAGLNKAKWGQLYPDVPFGKDECRAYFGYKVKKDVNDPWSGGNVASANLNAFEQRLDCLSNGIGIYGAGAPGLTENSAGGECANLNSTHNYSVRPEGKALKWNTYHYIVARNYLPKVIQEALQGADIKTGRKIASYRTGARGEQIPVYEDVRTGFSGKEMNLCSEFNNPFRKARHSGGGVGASGEFDYTQLTPEETEELRLVWSAARTHTKDRGNKNNTTLQYAEGSVEPESLADACVIYVAHSTILDWEQQFKPTMVEMFEELLTKIGYTGEDKSQKAVEAFDQLDLMFIESASMKHKLGTTHNLKQLLPLPYWVFTEAYIVRRGTTTKDKKEGGYHTNVDRRKFRMENEIVHGAKCFFDRSVSLSCQDDSFVEDGQGKKIPLPTATVTFNKSYKGSQREVEDIKAESIEVRASFVAHESTGNTHLHTPQTFRNPKPEDDGNGNVVYKYTYSKLSGNKDFGHQDVDGQVIWNLYRNGMLEQTRICSFNNKPDGEPIIPPSNSTACTDGEVMWNNDENAADGKENNHCSMYKECKNGAWDATWTKVTPAQDPDCGERPIDKDDPKPQVVELYGDFPQFPSKGDILQAKYRTGFNGKEDPTNKTWGTCKFSGTSRLVAVDDDTRAYMQAAKAKFDQDQANAAEKITLNLGNENNWNVANLVDAIMIDPQNGQVPANTVCMLGKTIGANAKDLQKGDQGFDNLFGAFLAFITPDAASFPSKYTRNSSGSKIRDERFRARGDTKPYYWGGYVDNKDRQVYEGNIAGGAWRTLPLRALQRDPLPKNGNLMQETDKENRKLFHDRYKDLMERGSCRYDSGAKVPATAALEYIGLLCNNGDKIKPAGMGWKAWAEKHPDEARQVAAAEDPYHRDNLDL